MTGRLQGKVCVITGAAGAIGHACASAFTREGAKVVGCDLDEQGMSEVCDKVSSHGGDIVGMGGCDLTDPGACADVVDLAISRYGAVDVVLNNAGRVQYGWMDDEAVDHWPVTIDGELNQVFWMTKATWPHLSRKGGAIVNIASSAGWIAYQAMGGVAHCAAKGGVIAMTRQLALEGRKSGIRANSISPGVIETPTTREKLKDLSFAGPMLGKLMRSAAGTPLEIANVAVFLASDESAFVNAGDIRADGGASAW